MSRTASESSGDPKLPRRLTSILAADIAGYSALMGADEDRTVQELKAHQAVILPMIGKHDGRIIDTAGDGILADFPSVLSAVQCALAIQEVMTARNAVVEPLKRMQYRIGINQGDVVFDEARLYGDGVNVAARLEAIADPGGICISGKVFEEVRKKIDALFEDIGPQKLKNIDEPVNAYRVRSKGVIQTTPSTVSRLDERKNSRFLVGGATALVFLIATGGIYGFRLLGTSHEPSTVAEAPVAGAPKPTPPAVGPSERPQISLQDGIERKSHANVPIEGSPAAAENERKQAPDGPFRDCDTCPEMLAVPAGSFMMGSPDAEPGRMKFEDPSHRVAISYQFAASRYAVSRDEFKAFVNSTGYAYGQTCHSQTPRGWSEREKKSFLAPPDISQGDDHPVVCVSWNDGQAYVRWLANRTGKPYRLLTEAEREYIARAGTATAFWWGQTVDPDQANYDTKPRPSRDTTAPGRAQPVKPRRGELEASLPTMLPGVATGGTRPVGWGRPNPWGFHQVHGNVGEWVEDCWNGDYTRTPTDGSAARVGDCSLRVVRGGAWSSWPEDIRSAYREMAGAAERYNSIGFRVARDLQR